MNNDTSVLAGIDFSESSPVVLRHALHCAATSGAKVVAAHVLDKSREHFRKASGLENPDFELIKSQAEEKFAKLLPKESGKADVEFVVRRGKPAEELNRLAEEEKVSFMVVSANDLTKKRLGSVAARCVRTASCDVLVLRDWHGDDFRKIAVCTDFSETADRAIRRAGSLAKTHGAELEIINVMYPPGEDSWGEVMDHKADTDVSYEDECRQVVAREMEKCVVRCADALDGVNYVTLVMESEMPSVAITEHVRSVGSDLVVMGTQGQSPILSHFIGTNAERLIQDAPVSVFAVR